MPDSDDNKSESFEPESQKQRWIKYGANVILTVIVVIILAILITWLAQRFSRRVDTTASGVYSLKPQTVNIIRQLKSPIRIVSLYSAKTPHEGLTETEQAESIQCVNDLLNEYKNKGKGIDVDFIDPQASPAKEDALIADVTQTYGGEVSKYKGFLTDYDKQYQQIKQLTADEAKTVKALPLEKIDDQQLLPTLVLIIDTVQSFPKYLQTRQENIERRLKQKPPDYKGATDSVRSSMDELSQRVAIIIERLNETLKQNSAKLPAEVKEYFTASIPRYQQMKTLADELVKKVDALGDLKLDTLRQSLRQRDTILVMGQNDLRVIPFDKVWRREEQIKSYIKDPDAKLRPRFAGEQQISTAIVALTESSKPKVAFVRAGGPPLTDQGIPGFQQGGPMSMIADRLREYNFDVVEKDLSGQWAMQSQMQGMPAAPEPSDADIKQAVWVVLATPTDQRMPAPSMIAPRVKEHLDAGGSAMLILFPQADNLASVTREWGIEGNTSAVCVHDLIKTTPAGGGDYLEEARRLPFVFQIRNYGDTELSRPLRSLESWLVPLLPVKTVAPTTQPVNSVKTAPLIPIPDDPKCWGETNIAALQSGDEVKFDADKGDVPAPLFGGAQAERTGAGRLVVIGSPAFIFDRNLTEPDPELARRGVFVSRFPGNSELFTNSIFWLSKLDTMIAISPSAMEVPRIRDMSDATLNAWRVGLLLVGLPGLVIAAGLMVFFARRD
jgi:hypothetical protein